MAIEVRTRAAGLSASDLRKKTIIDAVGKVMRAYPGTLEERRQMARIVANSVAELQGRVVSSLDVLARETAMNARIIKEHSQRVLGPMQSLGQGSLNELRYPQESEPVATISGEDVSEESAPMRRGAQTKKIKMATHLVPPDPEVDLYVETEEGLEIESGIVMNHAGHIRFRPPLLDKLLALGSVDAGTTFLNRRWREEGILV